MPRRRTVAPAGWVAAPEPGIALLRLAQGQHEVAAATLARATDEATGIFARARLLEPLVEVMLATGSTPAARLAADELVQIAGDIGAPLLTAMAERANGAVLLAEGDPRAALAALRPSWTQWQALDAPYEAARTRVLIGLACRALDDADAAALELDAAADAFRELGARPDLARVEALRDEARAAAGRWAHGPRGRGAAARRRRARRIARSPRDLVISDRTVARHVSNIFDKLGVPSRAAATAYAYEHGLIAPPWVEIPTPADRPGWMVQPMQSSPAPPHGRPRNSTVRRWMTWIKRSGSTRWSSGAGRRDWRSVTSWPGSSATS